MQDIEPGTLCCLVGLEDHPDFDMHVVTVLGRVNEPDDPKGIWYEVDAHWLRKISDSLWTVEHSLLKPLYPDTLLPGVESTDQTEV